MTTPHAALVRAQKRSAATQAGLDDALISSLVDAFYARVQTDELLGPIFARHVADWAHHLPRMKDFWASIMIESGRFAGRPMQKHIALGILDQTHFDRWLALWDETVATQVANTVVADNFRASAHRIADSLLTGVLVERGGLAALHPQSINPATGARAS